MEMVKYHNPPNVVLLQYKIKWGNSMVLAYKIPLNTYIVSQKIV